MHHPSIEGYLQSRPIGEVTASLISPHQPAGMLSYMLPRPMPPPIDGNPYTMEQISFPPPSMSCWSSHMSNFISSRLLDIQSDSALQSDFPPHLPLSPPPRPPPLPSEGSLDLGFLLMKEPQRPQDIEMLKQIESFVAYVVENGSHVENVVREKQGSNPGFVFLFPNE